MFSLSSISARHSAQLRSRRQAKISSSNQETCRNSKAIGRSGGRIERKFCRISKFFLSDGGSWKSTAPLLGPSEFSARKRYSTSSLASWRRLICVILCGALRTKRKLGGTCSAQFCRTLSLGTPQKVLLISTAGGREA